MVSRQIVDSRLTAAVLLKYLQYIAVWQRDGQGATKISLMNTLISQLSLIPVPILQRLDKCHWMRHSSDTTQEWRRDINREKKELFLKGYWGFGLHSQLEALACFSDLSPLCCTQPTANELLPGVGGRPLGVVAIDTPHIPLVNPAN